jgi:hypothetical protein
MSTRSQSDLAAALTGDELDYRPKSLLVTSEDGTAAEFKADQDLINDTSKVGFRLGL